MAAAELPDGVMDRILEVLQPEEVWLFGSRARDKGLTELHKIAVAELF